MKHCSLRNCARVGLAALALVLGELSTQAQPPMPAPLHFGERDVVFVVTAAQDSLAQLALGRLLQQKAQTQLLRDYGTTLVEDHLLAYARLVALADAMGIELLAELPGPQSRQLERLAELTEVGFDQAALQMAVEEQEQQIARYSTAVDHLTHLGLAEFVRDTLPVLRQHLDRARVLSR